MGLGPVHIGYAVIIQLLLYVHFTLIVSLTPVPSRFCAPLIVSSSVWSLSVAVFVCVWGSRQLGFKDGLVLVQDVAQESKSRTTRGRVEKTLRESRRISKCRTSTYLRKISFKHVN